MRYWEQRILITYDAIHSKRIAPDEIMVGDSCDVIGLANVMYVLAASLILDLCDELGSSDTQMWQVSQGLNFLNHPQVGAAWVKCYLGSWPALVFGHAVRTVEEVAIVKRDLESRYEKLLFVEDLLYLQELESLWQRKGLSTGASYRT